jgi:hypothetical protein
MNTQSPSISRSLCLCLYINVVALAFIDWVLGCSRISRRVWETVELPLSTVTVVVVVPLCTTSVQTTAACSHLYICYVHQWNTNQTVLLMARYSQCRTSALSDGMTYAQHCAV